MKKHFIRKACSGLLATALILTCAAPPGADAVWAASLPKDVRGHWAQKYIEKTIDAGIVKGYGDGSFRPDEPVTRAEFCHMVNQTLGNTNTAATSFRDVSRSDWFYSAVSKGVAAGYVSGYSNGTFRPDLHITRQEAATMLSRVVPTTNAANLSKYPDYQDVESWARPAMEYIVGRGYIGTYSDGKIYPQDNMTRAQAATIISNVLTKETIVKSDPNVTKDGTRLSGTIYSNGVTLGKNLGSGDVTLSNSVVLGSLNVQGGNNVTVDGCRISQANIQSSSNVDFTVRGNSSIKNTTVSNTATVETASLTGGSYGNGFENLSISRSADTTLRGNFPAVNIDGTTAKVHLTSGKIDTLNVSSSGKESNITVDSGATVSVANVGAESYFRGTGTVSRMVVNANNVTYEKKPNTVVMGSGIKNPAEESGLSISIDPSYGKSNVKVDDDIVLTFNTAVKLYNGNTIYRTDIEDFVVLRKRSDSGTKVPFTGSIDSAKKKITITPEDPFDDDTKYYISIDWNKLKNSDGDSNSTFSSYFTTGDESGSEYITFTPKNKASNVSISRDLTIKFTERMVNYDGSTINNSDLSDIITFRRGTSSSGSRVLYNATIDSDKRTITISPEKKLEDDTTYYLAVNSRTVKTYSGGNAVPAASITFSTGDMEDDSDYCTFYPKNSATGVEPNVTPEVRFTEKMVCYDKSDISSNDLRNDIFTLRNVTRGKDVTFTASISSAKTVTIKPSSNLEEGCKYTLYLNSRTVRTAEDYTVVPSASVSWTVRGGNTTPNASIGTPTSGTDSVSFTVSNSSSVSGTAHVVLLKGNPSTPTNVQVYNHQNASGVVVPTSQTSGISANGSVTFTFRALEPNTAYRLYAVVSTSSTNISSVASASFTTTTPTSISPLTVSATADQGTATVTNSGTNFTVEVPYNAASVKISLGNPGGRLHMNGTDTFDTAAFDVSIVSNQHEYTYNVLSSKSLCADTSYTVKVKVKGNTALTSVVSDVGTNETTGTSYIFKIPFDATAMNITITAVDLNGKIQCGPLSGIGTLEVPLSGNSIPVEGGNNSFDFEVTSKQDPPAKYTIRIEKGTNPNPPDPTTPPAITPTPSAIAI